MTRKVRCWVCSSLPVDLLVELDRHLRDVDAWPADLREQLQAGRVKRSTVLAWAAERYLSATRPDISRGQLQVHIEHRAESAIARDDMDPTEPSGAVALTAFYMDALKAGRLAFDELVKRIGAKPGAEGEADVETLSNDQLLKVAELAGKYATSAAALRQRGPSPLADDQPPLLPPGKPAPEPPSPPASGGFMDGSAPRPSGRMAHHRVRVVDGESRPVVDEGPKDRAAYNARAAQEGGPRL